MQIGLNFLKNEEVRITNNLINDEKNYLGPINDNDLTKNNELLKIFRYVILKNINGLNGNLIRVDTIPLLLYMLPLLKNI